jgi:hypothetical protein
VTQGGVTQGGETPGGETQGGETQGGETQGGETPGLGERPKWLSWSVLSLFESEFVGELDRECERLGRDLVRELEQLLVRDPKPYPVGDGQA